MPDYGLLNDGFVPKSLAQILDDINTNMSYIVHPETGEFMFRNASDDSIIQQINGVYAEALSECWQAAQEVFAQFDPLKNSGAGQSGTMQLNGLLRSKGGHTVLEVDLYGDMGLVIPENQRISDGKNIYITQSDVSLDDTGWGYTTAVCEEVGAILPENGTVVQILTPVRGWERVYNNSIVAPGRNPETDEEARLRQQQSTANTAFRQIDAIYANIRNVPGVTYCRVYQNNRFYPADARGIPYKEIAVVVEGGDPREIATRITERAPVTVQGYGNNYETFYDAQNVAYAVYYSRPIEIPISVEIDITVVTPGLFPDLGAHMIKRYIVEYAQYGDSVPYRALEPTSADVTVLSNKNGFPPGMDVIPSRLYTPTNLVPGIRIDAMRVGLINTELKEETYPIKWNEVARFVEERIKVNITVDPDDD